MLIPIRTGIEERKQANIFVKFKSCNRMHCIKYHTGKTLKSLSNQHKCVYFSAQQSRENLAEPTDRIGKAPFVHGILRARHQ
jgi:hypothetical protein